MPTVGKLAVVAVMATMMMAMAEVAKGPLPRLGW
jgi:hypothetical protein